MDERIQLFSKKQIYNHEDTDTLFLRAVKKNVAYHAKNCQEYRNILKKRGFSFKQLSTIEDLHQIPPIPTLYLKTHHLISKPLKCMLIKATSSGTKGIKSQVGFDLSSLYYGFHMVKNIALTHKLFSIKPTNYIMLGYKPNKSNSAIIAKTAFGATFLAPAIRRKYALDFKEGEYQLDLTGLKKALLSYCQQPYPVRIIGFPAYLYFLLLDIKKTCKKGGKFSPLKLHPDSMIFLGGGWKQFYQEKVEKERLYDLVHEVLGIKEANIREFFGAAEHPIVYCDCKNHHFHVPAFSRVIIRDVTTLLPVGYDKVGLMNLVTPMMDSLPLVSVMTDDLAVLHEGKECGCGLKTPYFEVIGRVGVQDIKTCAQGAEKMLRGE